MNATKIFLVILASLIPIFEFRIFPINDFGEVSCPAHDPVLVQRARRGGYAFYSVFYYLISILIM